MNDTAEGSTPRIRILRSLQVADANLNEHSFPAGNHNFGVAATHPVLRMAARGAYVESIGGEQVVCNTSVVVLKPLHGSRVSLRAESPAVGFSVELLDPWVVRLPAMKAVQEGAVFKTGMIPQLMRRLYEEFRYPDAATPLAIEGLLLEIMGECRRSSCNREERVPNWLRDVKQDLLQSFRDPPGLEELGRKVGVHPVHLARSFREKYRTSINAFIHQLRIEYACHRITEPDLSLSELALDAGFSDQSHFTKIFKRQTGFTPAQYRHMTKRS